MLAKQSFFFTLDMIQLSYAVQKDLELTFGSIAKHVQTHIFILNGSRNSIRSQHDQFCEKTFLMNVHNREYIMYCTID